MVMIIIIIIIHLTLELKRKSGTPGQCGCGGHWRLPHPPWHRGTAWCPRTPLPAVCCASSPPLPRPCSRARVRGTYRTWPGPSPLWTCGSSTRWGKGTQGKPGGNSWKLMKHWGFWPQMRWGVSRQTWWILMDFTSRKHRNWTKIWLIWDMILGYAGITGLNQLDGVALCTKPLSIYSCRVSKIGHEKKPEGKTKTWGSQSNARNLGVHIKSSRWNSMEDAVTSIGFQKMFFFGTFSHVLVTHLVKSQHLASSIPNPWPLLKFPLERL